MLRGYKKSDSDEIYQPLVHFCHTKMFWLCSENQRGWISFIRDRVMRRNDAFLPIFQQFAYFSFNLRRIGQFMSIFGILIRNGRRRSQWRIQDCTLGEGAWNLSTGGGSTYIKYAVSVPRCAYWHYEWNSLSSHCLQAMNSFITQEKIHGTQKRFTVHRKE